MSNEYSVEQCRHFLDSALGALNNAREAVKSEKSNQDTVTEILEICDSIKKLYTSLEK